MSILVFADHTNGKFKKSTHEVLTYGRKMGDSVTAIVLGNIAADELAALGQFGATKVLHIASELDNQAAAKAIAEAAKKENANTLVFSFDVNGKSLAPRVAAVLGAGYVPGVTTVPDTANGFSVKKNVFSGKAIAEIAITSPVRVLAVSPNSLQPENTGGAATVETFAPAVSNNAKVRVVEVKKQEGEIALPEADLVVSAGRGLKGPENWGMIEELAATIGAATACSRPVSDIGWRPHHEHVGQTGITVRPNLYIAIGISGAIQHLAGVNGSKTIVVINKDAEAPFFKAADYGVLGDAFEVVPRLTEAFKKFKQENH